MTAPLTPEQRAVLRGLSEAQRNAIFWLSEDWIDDRHSDALVPVLWSDDAIFLRPAIIEYEAEHPRGWRTVHRFRLTPLGLLLRQSLIPMKGESK